MDSQNTLQELTTMYADGIEVDKEIYAEQRSNILLISGEHYNKKNSKWMSHIRDNSSIDNDQRIRLTRNHISRIYQSYVNKYVAMAPGTFISPQNEKELKDQKAAELSGSIWNGIKYRHKMAAKVQQWAGSFVGHGEVFVVISWDWEKGEFKSTNQVMSPDGQMKEETKWTGDLDFEEIYGTDVFRPKGCQDLDKAEWLGYRKLASSKMLKEKYKEQPEKLKAVDSDGQHTYLIFDDSGYKDAKDMCLVKTVFYRPCFKYPKGYFYMYTTNVILEEGELPAGVFPVKYALHDTFSTHPRGRSRIKQLKPYQVEVNRVGSKMAEHQITLGDDKLVLTHGGKMSAGGQLNGVRALSVTGQSPLVIPGRTGDQYLGYANSIIAEMYNIAMLQEEIEERAPTQVDPYALILTSSRWKEKFSLYTQKFERFLCDITELSLDIYKEYVEEDTLVYDIGDGERVNIPEFKNAKKLCYQIKVDPQTEDISTRIGKKMSIDRYIQYSSGNLQKEDLGKFLRLDPFLNKEQMFEDFTTEYDNSVNDILAMDRGQVPLINPYKYNDPNYPVKRFASRMSQSDFQHLAPQIQGIYQQVVGQYQMLIEKKIQDTAALNSEFIPSGGALVRSDMWVPDPVNPAKQVRASVPVESLQWLVDRLAAQGSTQAMLQKQRQGVITDMVSQMRSQSGHPAAQQPGSAQALQSRINNIPGQGERGVA